MESYKEYAADMNEIYGRFFTRKKDLHKLGTQPESMVHRREGCYVIVFRWGSEVTEPLATFSARVGAAVPAAVSPELLSL